MNLSRVDGQPSTRAAARRISHEAGEQTTQVEPPVESVSEASEVGVGALGVGARDLSGRAFDIVLWGATGATGRRVAHHLARRCRGRSFGLAFGGRNRAKLEKTREDLPDSDNHIALLTGDNHDEAFMAELAARARVMASTVGPFALYGSELEAGLEPGHEV